MRFNPVLSFLYFIGYALTNRLHFHKNRIGEILIAVNGQEFTIFRQVIIKPNKRQPEKPGATFKVNFRISNMSPKQNKVFSLLPIPFFIGLPGFRSKLWTLDESNGEFQGIYEWDTAQDAEKYAGSFAMKFVTMRSIPRTIHYEIFS